MYNGIRCRNQPKVATIAVANGRKQNSIIDPGRKEKRTKTTEIIAEINRRRPSKCDDAGLLHSNSLPQEG